MDYLACRACARNGRRSVEAGARRAPPAPGAALLGQRARGVVSLHLRTLAREGRMAVTIGRRELLAALGGAAACPLAARAQQPAMPVIGFLHPTSPVPNLDFLRAFRQGLKDTGYVEGENVAVEYRWAENQLDRLPVLTDELVRRKVAVIVTIGTAAFIAKAATTTIPIVSLSGIDPVADGLVSSLARPGGNLTGINLLSLELTTKRLELLHELVPDATRIAVLVNPNFF